MLPRLASNSRSSCPSLWDDGAGITGAHHTSTAFSFSYTTVAWTPFVLHLQINQNRNISWELGIARIPGQCSHLPGLSTATDITLIAGHSVPHACTASSKLHKDATQSARHPCKLGIIITICRTRKPREVHSLPQGCLAGGWQDLSFVLGVADSTVLCHQDSPSFH